MAAVPPCPLYAGLEARVNELKRKFVLDQVVAEAADPSFSADLDRLAAFRLLVHAEIEEYLESMAREGLDALEAGFNGDQAIRSNLNLLVIGAMLGRVARFDTRQWSTFAGEVLSAARSVVLENNGIKESSFLQLAAFCGRMPDEADLVLSSALTAYGKSRGDVAHKSVQRVRTIRAPSAESKDADDLLAGLKSFFY